MHDAQIAGIGMTRFGRHPGETVRSLAARSVAAALADAGTAPDDVGMVFFANAADGVLTGQESIRGQVALRDTGLLGAPIVNVENACASASTAVHLAVAAIASGSCEVALAVGAEKLSNDDRARTSAAFDGCVDVERRPQLERTIYGADGGAGNGSLFMDIYADLARRYMERSGATELDFAQVAAKNRRHGAANPDAQFREPSRPRAEPRRRRAARGAHPAAARPRRRTPGRRRPDRPRRERRGLHRQRSGSRYGHDSVPGLTPLPC